MRLRTLTILLATLSVFDLCYGEVRFEGSAPVEKTEIVRMLTRTSVTADSVRIYLVDRGYLDAVVAVKGADFEIATGEMYILESVSFIGDTSITMPANVPFEREAFERLVEDGLDQLREQGHIYTTAAVERISRDHGRVTVVLRVSSGPRVSVGRSVITGLSRSDPELVRRYISLETGDTLTWQRVDEATKQALAIPFVTLSPPVTVRPRPGHTEADVVFNFTEKRQVLFEGVGGYIPGDDAALVWDLKFRFQNLFGKGRRIAFESERPEKGRNILDIAYSQPLFLFGAGEAKARLFTRDYRDEFYEFSAEGEYLARPTPNFTTGLRLGWRTVEPEGELPSYQSFSASFLIGRSSIDRPINPRSGWSIDWTIAFAYRRYSGDSLAAIPEQTAFNETRNELSIALNQPLAGRVIAHIGLAYVGLETNESLPPVSELYYIGGPPVLRGFRHEQFTALRSAYGTLEPRLRFDGGYLFGFYDGAYLNNRIPAESGDGVVTDEIYRYGYGFGLFIEGARRSVKLSLGWNPDISYDEPRLSVEFSSDI